MVVRLLFGLAFCGVALADPLFVTVGDDPGTLDIVMPAGSPYKVLFDGGKLSIRNPAEVSPGVIYFASPAQADADGDGDVDLTDFGVFQVCFTPEGGTAPPGCEMMDWDGDGDVDIEDYVQFNPLLNGPLSLDGDFDGNGVVGVEDCTHFASCLSGPSASPTGSCCDADMNGDSDVDLWDFGLFQRVYGNTIPKPDTIVRLGVQGLSHSNVEGDLTLEVQSDSDGDGTFEVVAFWSVTVVEFAFDRTSVSPETALTVSMQPALSAGFGAGTCASYHGEFQPVFGADADVSITFGAGLVLPRSATEAVIPVGWGTCNAPLSAFSSPGVLVGKFTFDLNGLELGSYQSFQLEPGSSNFYSIGYTDENVPTNGFPLPGFDVCPCPLPSEEDMFVSTAHHFAVNVRVDKTPETSTLPANINVRVLTLDTVGAVRDNILVPLVRLPNDFEPNCLVYTSLTGDFGVPLMPVNCDVDSDSYTVVRPFETVDNGSILVVREGVTP